MTRLALWCAVALLMPLAWCAPARAADRDTAVALISGAEGLAKQGLYDKAADMCQRALAADDTCGQAYYQLALCQAKLNHPRDAMRNFQKAEALATAQKDDVLARKAHQDAEKLCPGLLQLDQADQKLVTRILPLAEEALEGGYLETARDLFDLVLGVAPDHVRAKEGAAQVRKLLDERGDPVQARLADAMLQEVWYVLGTGKKDDASRMAGDLSGRYPATSAGREAAELVRNNFGPPRKEDTVALAKKIKAAKPKAKPPETIAALPEKTGPAVATGDKTATPLTNPPPKRKCFMDLDALEANATAEAAKLPKEGLAPAFNNAIKAGQDWYSKAAPGTEGNQANLAKAVEQFVRCEALYNRMEEEKLADADTQKQLQQVSMLKYGCLKMVVLSQ